MDHIHRSITISTEGDVSTRSRDGRTTIETSSNFDASVNYHPKTREDFIDLAERLHDATDHSYDETRWVRGEIAPGITANVFVPRGVTVTLA